MQLEVVEGLRHQSADEQLIYTITTTNWASTPTTPVVAAYVEPSLTDVTTTVFPTNTPTVASNTISLSPLKSLVKGFTYRIEVKFTAAGSIWECFFRVKCEI